MTNGKSQECPGAGTGDELQCEGFDLFADVTGI